MVYVCLIGAWFGSLVAGLVDCAILGFWRCRLFGFLMGLATGGLLAFLDSVVGYGGLAMGLIVDDLM